MHLLFDWTISKHNTRVHVHVNLDISEYDTWWHRLHTMHWYVILHVQYMNIIRNLTPRPLILHTSGAFHETFELFTSIVTTTPNVGSWDIRYYKYSAIARFVFVNMSVVSVEHYELFIHIFVCLHVGTLDIIWKRQLSAPVWRAWWLLSWTAAATGLRSVIYWILNTIWIYSWFN